MLSQGEGHVEPRWRSLISARVGGALPQKLANQVVGERLLSLGEENRDSAEVSLSLFPGHGVQPHVCNRVARSLE